LKLIILYQEDICPFHELPAEIRVHIYSFIIPTVIVQPVIPRKYRDRDSRRPGPLKGNFEEVCPAMLRTNKQIYNEMVVEWYGSVRYGGVIDTTIYHTGLGFLNNALRKPYVDSNYRFIQRLDLSLTLYYPDPRSVRHATLLTAMERARLFIPPLKYHSFTPTY
jgi:hypothetical protein